MSKRNFIPFLKSLNKFLIEKNPMTAATVLASHIDPLIINLVNPLHAFLNVSVFKNSNIALPANPASKSVAISINLSIILFTGAIPFAA